MAIITETSTVALTASPVINLKGRGKAMRETAYMQIAPLSFIENISRVESIANLRVALGSSPTEAETATAQVQWVIGRVASRLPAGEFPKAGMDDGDKLDFARKLVTLYAAPVQDGKKARKLRAGQLGRRSIVQHKVIRAAEEAWSLVKAELGLGKAQTLSERNAKKATRAPHHNKAAGATPSHTSLVKPDKAADADGACSYLMQMATTLQQYASKNARVIPTDFGSAVVAFKAAINKAENERQVRLAAAK